MTARWRRQAAALIGSSHPGPTLVVTLITLGLGIAVGAPTTRVALLTVGMFAGQLSVGWSNDWLDADRDRAAQRSDKPVADGQIAVRLVRNAALIALIPGLLLPALASPPAGALHLVFVASAWSYNLGLKSRLASVVPYLVSFGALPALATLIAEPPRLPPWWAFVVGAALGLAAHFANVVPDVAADRVAGVRGLPQRLGARASGVTAGLVLLATTVIVAVVAQHGVVGQIAVMVAAGCSAAALGTALRAQPGRAPFRLVMVAALALVVVLLAAGTVAG